MKKFTLVRFLEDNSQIVLMNLSAPDINHPIVYASVKNFIRKYIKEKSQIDHWKFEESFKTSSEKIVCNEFMFKLVEGEVDYRKNGIKSKKEIEERLKIVRHRQKEIQKKKGTLEYKFDQLHIEAYSLVGEECALMWVLGEYNK